MLAAGRVLWERLADLGRTIREQLRDGDAAVETLESQRRVAGSLMGFVGTLPAVYADTWSISSRREVLECLRSNVRTLVEALDHWRLLAEDVRALKPDLQFEGLDL